MRREFRPDLYLVTDRVLSRGRPVRDIVSAAVRGGVTMVQLREKELPRSRFISQAGEIKEILGGSGIPLIINDDVEVALAVDADGVHLGRDDMPCSGARKLLGKDKIIGLSVESVQDAGKAEETEADYLGISPVFLTPTKRELTRELGLEGVSAIRAASGKPLVGIGGLNNTNAAEVIRAGADGVAVVSAICSAEDPEYAARELFEIIQRVKRQGKR